jgi:hypothetical protein
LYEYQYVHDFRAIEVALMLKKKYEKHIEKVNACNTL